MSPLSNWRRLICVENLAREISLNGPVGERLLLSGNAEAAWLGCGEAWGKRSERPATPTDPGGQVSLWLKAHVEGKRVCDEQDDD